LEVGELLRRSVFSEDGNAVGVQPLTNESHF
jgi:hypothetical protein